MFHAETAREAWAYWRWRTLRALVPPAQDYDMLARLFRLFGPERVFVQTSNCDQLHVRAGLKPESIHEIHGSLGRLQCAYPCTRALWPVDEALLTRLRDDPAFVPPCPSCARCLRPNVMIFDDHALVESELQQQQQRQAAFLDQFRGADGLLNVIILEIGAGVVVPSIRENAELFGGQGAGLIRVNPSPVECSTFQSRVPVPADKFFPLQMRCADALMELMELLSNL